MNHGKTSSRYWDSLYSEQPTPGLPSRFSVGSRNLQRLFRRYIRPGMRVLELGCAPGKQLAYLHKQFGATVAGLDYSQQGIRMARRLFETLRIDGDLRCEDLFSTSFPQGAFDVAYSLGVIEHFDDPRDIVRRHVTLVKPGGTALMAVPNYSGIYGRLQSRFDPDNLAIHNTRIMIPARLRKLAPADLSDTLAAFAWGRASPWLLNLDRKWPRSLALAISLCANTMGLLQPFDIGPLCPMVVLAITRKDRNGH